MLTQENLILTRAEPNGDGGLQFLYRVGDYGVAAISRPQEEVVMINWEMDIIKYLDPEKVKYELCTSTKLGDKTLVFQNDHTANDFLGKAFEYFKELNQLEGMLPDQN